MNASCRYSEDTKVGVQIASYLAIVPLFERKVGHLHLDRAAVDAGSPPAIENAASNIVEEPLVQGGKTLQTRRSKKWDDFEDHLEGVDEAERQGVELVLRGGL